MFRLASTYLLVFVSIVQFCWSTAVVDGRKPEIHLGAFITNVVKDELCYKAAIDTAVQMINKDDSILKDYTVRMNYLDNYGMPGFGISEFFKIREMDNVLQMLLGPFTEKYADPIRELSHKMKLPMFEDNDETHQSLRQAIVSLLKLFKWKRVSLMYDFKYLDYVEGTKNLEKELRAESIDATSVQGFSSRAKSDTHDQITHLKEQDSRIVIVDANRWSMSTIFCDAYLKNMTFPKNVFISGSIDDLGDGWHLDIPDNLRRCTPEQIQSAAEGFIFLKRSNFRITKRLHRAKMNRSEIWNLIRSRKERSWKSYLETEIPKEIIRSPRFEKASIRVFDLVYRAALAFDALLKKYDEKTVLMSKYDDEAKYWRITDAMKEVEFDGVSGKHRRGELGHEMDHIIYQYRNGSFVEMGYHASSDDRVVFHKGKDMFLGHRVPLDGVQVKDVILKYKTPLLVSMWSGAILGLLLSAFLLIVNLYYRKKRVIKMSSPNVNNIIIFGCMLCYISIIIHGIDAQAVGFKRTNYYLCSIFVCALSIGFTLSFGGLFSKTWRVFRIFAAARTNTRVAVRDGQLYVMIFCLVFVDVVILSGFLYTSPFELKNTEISRMLNKRDDILTVYIQQRCYCENNLSFLLTLMAYKVVLLAFGLFMAWETRNVSIPVLNDSKQIGITIYIIAFVSTVGVIAATALSTTFHHEESYVVVGVSVCLCTTATLLLVFYPKIILIYDKSGRYRTKSSSSLISHSSTSSSSSTSYSSPDPCAMKDCAPSRPSTSKLYSSHENKMSSYKQAFRKKHVFKIWKFPQLQRRCDLVHTSVITTSK